MNPLWPVLPYLVALVLVTAGVAALAWLDTRRTEAEWRRYQRRVASREALARIANKESR